MKKNFTEILWSDFEKTKVPLFALGKNGYTKSKGVIVYYDDVYSTIVAIHSKGLGRCYIEIPTEKLKELIQKLERSLK